MTPSNETAARPSDSNEHRQQSLSGSPCSQSSRVASSGCTAHPGDALPLPSPVQLREEMVLSPTARDHVAAARARLADKIRLGDGAPIAIVGPCSIHCETAALEYAERLAALNRRISNRVQVVMRVYFEKPRTTVGWKGFLYDPEMNGTDDLRQGLQRSRDLLVKISELGLPIATEILDPLVADYFEDCLSWVAIGARTSESQIHRQLASRLSCPVGFKNSTDGSVEVAIQASQAARQPHAHLGIDEHGRIAMRRGLGNSATHVVLRGGNSGPNFDYEGVSRAARALTAQGQRPAVLVDCSHGNSLKDYRRQPHVAREVFAQMQGDHADVLGVMVESHLQEGRQPVEGERQYGVSVTDGCIDFGTTEALLLELAGR